LENFTYEYVYWFCPKGRAKGAQPEESVGVTNDSRTASYSQQARPASQPASRSCHPSRPADACFCVTGVVSDYYAYR
jgi:hypothetical protein